MRAAAVANGRKFYIMHDVSGWKTMAADMKVDWMRKMSALTKSPAYARPFESAECLEILDGGGVRHVSLKHGLLSLKHHVLAKAAQPQSV